jgi:hypothetical protein
LQSVCHIAGDPTNFRANDSIDSSTYSIRDAVAAIFRRGHANRTDVSDEHAGTCISGNTSYKHTSSDHAAGWPTDVTDEHAGTCISGGACHRHTGADHDAYNKRRSYHIQLSHGLVLRRRNAYARMSSGSHQVIRCCSIL